MSPRAIPLRFCVLLLWVVVGVATSLPASAGHKHDGHCDCDDRAATRAALRYKIERVEHRLEKLLHGLFAIDDDIEAAEEARDRLVTATNRQADIAEAAQTAALEAQKVFYGARRAVEAHEDDLQEAFKQSDVYIEASRELEAIREQYELERQRVLKPLRASEDFRRLQQQVAEAKQALRALPADASVSVRQPYADRLLNLEQAIDQMQQEAILRDERATVMRAKLELAGRRVRDLSASHDEQVAGNPRRQALMAARDQRQQQYLDLTRKAKAAAKQHRRMLSQVARLDHKINVYYEWREDQIRAINRRKAQLVHLKRALARL